MTGQAFADLIYTGLNQRGISFIVGKDALLNFMNLGLADIYSFEGRYWSFMYETEQIVIPTTTDTSYTHTTQYPILRLQNIFDKKNNVSQFKRKNVNINLQEKDLFYRPLTTKLVIYNNTDGYQLDYVHVFNPLTSLSQELPIPFMFMNALYDLTMAYILPIYAQAGEGREVNVYQRGMNKLKELAKLDANPIEQLKSNIV